jgi:hypothetical protein
METTTLDNWMEDLDDKLNTTNVDLIALITKHLKYFEKQIVLAVRKRLSLVVHCRGARRLPSNYPKLLFPLFLSWDEFHM